MRSLTPAAQPAHRACPPPRRLRRRAERRTRRSDRPSIACGDEPPGRRSKGSRGRKCARRPPLGSLRTLSHGSGRSPPSRDKPLTAVFVGRWVRERLAERTRRERSTLSALITNRMGIDIYAEWTGMTGTERAAQWGCCGPEHGHVGYLREACDGEPYATMALVPEAFDMHRAPIYAEKLQARLPAALEIAEQREREIYGSTRQCRDQPHAPELRRLRRVVRAKGSRDRRALSHCSILLTRSYPPLTRRVRHASASAEARPRLSIGLQDRKVPRPRGYPRLSVFRAVSGSWWLRSLAVSQPASCASLPCHGGRGCEPLRKRGGR